MRFLILNTDYPGFLEHLYRHDRELHKKPYEQQMRQRAESLFAVADFYSRNLRKLGHEAQEICANNWFAQSAWARENGVRVPSHRTWSVRWFKGIMPLPGRSKDDHWIWEILRAQIASYRPDVLLNQAMRKVPPRFLREVKPLTKLLVGQHAATPLPDSEDWGCYDLVISSFPPTVRWFMERGIRSEIHRLGFEPEVLSRLVDTPQERLGISFIGSLFSVHRSRIEFLEQVARHFHLQIWAPTLDYVSHDSLLRKNYMGQAWGLQMYQLLRQSKLAINHHGDVAPYANNLRLYEATGVGACLVTDWKPDIHELFEPGREIVTYATVEECVELIRYYLDNDEERRTIARKGQERTLREHTYYRRMEELIEILDRYV